MLLERVWLALQKPETWYAIATGAGVFGVPVGMVVAWWTKRRRAARSFSDDYWRGYDDAYAEVARRDAISRAINGDDDAL